MGQGNVAYRGLPKKLITALPKSYILHRPSPPSSFPPQLNFHPEAALHADLENLTGRFGQIASTLRNILRGDPSVLARSLPVGCPWSGQLTLKLQT